MRSTLLLAMTLASVPVVAQGEVFRFRYQPASGRGIQSLTETRTVTTMTGLPRVPDGTAVEVEARIFAHERVMGTSAGGFRVGVGVDSVRVRGRQGEAAWVDLPTPPFAGRSTRAEVTDRLHVTGIETTAPEDGTLLRILTGWVANLGFAFPDSAVPVGGTFRPGAQVPFEVTLSDDAGIGVSEVLLGDLALTLDSLVARPGDTLAYLRFGGQFTPRTVETAGEGGSRSDTFEGGFVGSLLWSTGWNAFVSAGLRVRVTGRLQQETAGGMVQAAVEWDATLVHRIRP
jgi:hypothetical protein